MDAEWPAPAAVGAARTVTGEEAAASAFAAATALVGMTPKAGKRPLRSLSAHEKMDAIRRVHDGESKASVARDIGVPESTLRGWCKNEDKILYLSRQSTPETDDSEPRDKKPRYDDAQPYNLTVGSKASSMDDGASLVAAAAAAAAAVYSPPVSAAAVAAAAVAAADMQSKPPAVASDAYGLNLSKQASQAQPGGTSPKGSSAAASAAAAATAAALSERERNRAELTRLSIELGLNRPEMFLPNTNLSLGELSATLGANLNLMAQWNNSLLQTTSKRRDSSHHKSSRSGRSRDKDHHHSQSQQQAHQQSQQQHGHHSPAQAHQQSATSQLSAADSTGAGTNGTSSSAAVAAAAAAAVDDSVWHWLKAQQAMQGMVQNPSSVDPNCSWFWRWYKLFGYAQQPDNKPILYQQLTKDPNAENVRADEGGKAQSAAAQGPQPAGGAAVTNGSGAVSPTGCKAGSGKARAVLDNLLLNHNNNNVPARKEETPASPGEALEHGEKFLRWLECCSDPSVTAMQILQFRYLLNNVRTCADRRNNASDQHARAATKVRSRK